MSTYCNLIRTIDGGTHYRELIKCIEKVWSRILPNESSVKFSKDDCRIGLYGVLSLTISEPSFTSQTKEKLNVDPKRLSDIMNLLESKIYEWLMDNDDIRKALIKRFEIYRQEKDKMTITKDIMSLIKLNDPISSNGKVKRRSVVKDLVECVQTKRDNTEIFFVEGKSAGGVAARARNNITQAVLPLRGKIKNITNLSIKDALNSEEVRGIVNAAGCGVGDDCDPSRSRYDRYMISTDADPDGLHIVALLLSVFVNLLAPLVKEGLVYAVIPPLYGYTINGKNYYTDSLEEIPKDLRETKRFTRFKGLGEMDDDQYEETCMNPNTRKVVQVQYPEDLERFNNILGTSSGKRELLVDLGVFRSISSDE